MIADFLRDVASIERIQTNSTILTPCHKISRDSSFTRSWTHEDWLQREWKGETTVNRSLPIATDPRFFFSRFCTTSSPLLAPSQ